MAKVLLLHCDGSNGSTSFPDARGHTVTANGNAQISTAQSKFDGASARFDGTGDHLTVDYVPVDFDWWTGEYTLALWVRPNDLATFEYTDGIAKPALIGNADVASNTNYWSFGPIASGAVKFTYFNGAQQAVTSTATVSAGDWSHLALVISGGFINIFVNGVGLAAPVAIAGTPQSSTTLAELVIGQISNRCVDAYVEEILIDKGTALYTANFTPPAAPYNDVDALIADITSTGGIDTVAAVVIDVLAAVADITSTGSIDTVAAQVFIVPVIADIASTGSIDAITAAVQIAPVIADLVSTGSIDAVEAVIEGEVPWTPVNAGWSFAVSMGGSDVSARLTGLLRVEIARRAARLAEFTLLPTGGSVNPESWVGAAVQIHYEGQLIFAGRVEATTFDPSTRTVAFSCSDGLQAKVAATGKPALLSLIGGRWNADVFDPNADPWTYAQDVLSTVPRDLDLSVAGTLRATRWHLPNSIPHKTWTESQFLDGSLRVELPQLRGRKNRITLAIEYRYPRLRHRQASVTWQAAPDICTWASAPYDLPSLGMLEQAIQDAGWELQGTITANLLTLGAHLPCGVIIDQSAAEEKFALSASWTAARRTSQTVTERYELRIDCASSIAQSGIIEDTIEIGFEEEEDAYVRDFEREPPTGVPAGAVVGDLGDHILDRRTEDRWQNAALVQIDIARVRILEGMRGYLVSVDVPLDPTLDITQKARIDATPLHGVDATGSVVEIVHVMDFDAGTAISSVTLDASQAGNGFVATQLADLPARPSTDQGLPPPTSTFTLDTHVGGAEGLPAFDDNWTGWTGNLQFPTGVSPILYDVRFKLPMPGLEEQSRDPVTFTRQKLDYTVSVPAPSLTLSV